MANNTFIDWNHPDVPKDAHFYSDGKFRKQTTLKKEYYFYRGQWSECNFTGLTLHRKIKDFQFRPNKPKNIISLSSIDILNSIVITQTERAKEYEQAGGERSFDRVAEIFNAYTKKQLLPSEVALILSILKYVRSEHTEEPHLDSYIDKVSYDSLWAELRIKEKTSE